MISGSADDDVSSGTAESDQIYGGDGKDQLFGKAGDDEIDGGGGDDELLGGDGNDELRGGSGNDELFGGSGNDELFGGAGDDELRGGDGNDVLNGGAGIDALFGGSGADKFYIDAIHDLPDFVMDFKPEEGDSVWLKFGDLPRTKRSFPKELNYHNVQLKANGDVRVRLVSEGWLELVKLKRSDLTMTVDDFGKEVRLTFVKKF
jgi:hypothetical protein